MTSVIQQTTQQLHHEDDEVTRSGTGTFSEDPFEDDEALTVEDGLGTDENTTDELDTSFPLHAVSRNLTFSNYNYG